MSGGKLSASRIVGPAISLGVLVLAAAAILAFLLLRGNGDGAPAGNQLTYLDADGVWWLVDVGNGDRRKLVEDGRCGLEWSPTGERLVCIGADSSGGFAPGRIVLRDANGAVVGQIEEDGIADFYWSPSGEAFLYGVKLFVEPPSTSARHYRIADASGQQIADLGVWDLTDVVWPGRAYHGFPLWSPDGGRLAYRSADTGEARIYSLNTGTERTLAGDYHPMGWALDGEALIVAANYAPPAQEMGFSSYEANLLDLSSGELTRLPELDGGVQFWVSPDGSHAVYLISGLTPVRGGAVPGLGVLDLGSGEFRAIPDSIITYGSDHIPKGWVTFTRDGEYVYWVGGDNAGYRARIDGAGLTRVVELEDQFAFAWSPDFTMITYNAFEQVGGTITTTLYTAKNDGTNVREIDTRTEEGRGIPFAAVWRPQP